MLIIIVLGFKSVAKTHYSFYFCSQRVKFSQLSPLWPALGFVYWQFAVD